MENKLTKSERNKLLSQHRQERDKRVCDRIKAVLAYDDGYSFSEIARLLLLDDETIRRHVQDYFSHRKLSPDNGGSQSLLNSKQTEDLIAHLDNVTYLYVKEICAYVKQEYKVCFSVSGMTKWLHNNGFCYKRPHAAPSKLDPDKQSDFIEEYEQLKKKAGNNEPIYFADSAHPQHQTRLAYGWIIKGKRKTIATTGRQYRLNIMGAICLSEHRVVYQQSDKVNELSIESFLTKLRKQHPGNKKIHIIWDNAGYHRSSIVQEHAKSLKIEIHYLPPYSPNLNPVERLWKLMHEQVTYNQYYETFKDFTEAIKHFFRNVSKKKIILRARITDNFQLLNKPNFAS